MEISALSGLTPRVASFWGEGGVELSALNGLSLRGSFFSGVRTACKFLPSWASG